MNKIDYYKSIRGYQVQIVTKQGERYLGTVTRVLNDYMVELVPCNADSLTKKYAAQFDMKGEAAKLVTFDSIWCPVHKNIEAITTVIVLDKSDTQYYAKNKSTENKESKKT